ncbi:MAG: hypothetical protein P8Y45_22670 [Exilibacterium sp.]
MNIWLSVFRADAKRILRDPFLMLIIVAPILFGFLLRWAVPEITAIFQERFDLRFFYPLIISVFILIPAFYVGAVMALQIVEEKDEGSLLAIAVTPFPIRRYFTLRVFIYTAVSIPVIVIVHRIAGIVDLPALTLWFVSLGISLQVPILALIVASLANNQIEGFAVMKGTGIFGVLPLAVFFVPDYWHLFAGILPTYWPVIAYFTAAKAGGSEVCFWLAIVVALLYQGVAVRYLFRRFERSITGE